MLKLELATTNLQDQEVNRAQSSIFLSMDESEASEKRGDKWKEP